MASTLIFILWILLIKGVQCGRRIFTESSTDMTNLVTSIDYIFSPTEYSALSDLYFGTNGPSWDWTNITVGNVPWQFETPANPCADNWEGIYCKYITTGHNSSCYVERLHLVYRNLSGQLPNSLQAFRFLKNLVLAANSLNGTIPAAIGNLSLLTKLDLSLNSLTGHIPEGFDGLLGLSDLVLDSNELSGTIPQWRNLPSLAHFALGYNYLTGTVPSIIGSYSLLKELYLNRNLLFGTLPNELGALTTLLTFDLDNNNQLTGTIPQEYEGLQSMVFLGLENSQISGTIPEFLGNLSELVFIYLFKAQFSGTIPSNLANIPHIRYIRLEHNFLIGSIPESFGNLSELIVLSVNNNFLRGTIPSSLSMLSKLEELAVQNNQLSGPIVGIFNHTVQTSLFDIDLSNNHFSGELPGEVFLLPKLSTFVCVSSCLRGKIPVEICNNESEVSTIILDNLHGSTNCPFHSVFDTNAMFHGTIPECVWQVPNLDTLHLSGNWLGGSLPYDLVLSSSLLSLDLSHNYLTGSVPASVQSRDWYSLDLSANRFSGNLITDFYKQSKQNYTFDRRTGKLSGYKSVSYYATPSERALRVQVNRFSGPIPQSIKNMLNISLVSGNIFSCDIYQSELPTHDHGDSTYSCDSSAFDLPNYFWLCSMAVTGGIVWLMWRNRDEHLKGQDEKSQKTKKKMTMLACATQALVNAHTYLTTWPETEPALQFLYGLMEKFAKLTLVCGGYIVTVLLILYTLCSIFYGTHTQEYTYTVSAIFVSGVVPFALIMCGLIALIATTLYFSELNRTHFSSRVSSIRFGTALAAVIDTERRRRLILCLVFVGVNVIVVVGVNIAFVVAALYASSGVMILAQILLCFFKIGWNAACTPKLIQWTSYQLRTEQAEQAAPAAVMFFSLQLFVALLNNIAIPSLVVAAIDPNCFLYIISPLPTETANYLYADCNYYSVNGCVEYSVAIAAVEYTPPFTYSYQCSASFITYYAPAFVFMSITAIFIVPIVTAVGVTWHTRAENGTIAFRILNRIVPRIWKPVNPDASTIRNIRRPIFNTSIVLVTLLTYAGILLTFGAMFPPLAAALVVAILATIGHVRYKLGRFMYMAEKAEQPSAVGVLEAECRDFVRTLNFSEALRMVVYFCFGFYSLFLFDMLGDAEGFGKSVWVLFVVPALPWIFFVLYDIHVKCQKSQDHDREEFSKPDIREDIEMKPTHLSISSLSQQESYSESYSESESGSVVSAIHQTKSQI